MDVPRSILPKPVAQTDYYEYIRSKAWGAKKAQYRASKMPQGCYVCGSKINIHLHHRTYERLGVERLHDLLPLCEKHHTEVHGFINAQIVFNGRPPAQALARGAKAVRARYLRGVRRQQREARDKRAKR